jgi:hypothetical protein
MHLAGEDLPDVPSNRRPTDFFSPMFESSENLIRDTRLAFRGVQPVF